jgi:hypothetical protein
VTQDLEGVGILIGQDRERRIRVERPVEITYLAVDSRGQGSPGKASADALGDLPRGSSRRHLTVAAVG